MSQADKAHGPTVLAIAEAADESARVLQADGWDREARGLFNFAVVLRREASSLTSAEPCDCGNMTKADCDALPNMRHCGKFVEAPQGGAAPPTAPAPQGLPPGQAALTAALTVLARYGVPPDIQELLTRGNPTMKVPPFALASAIAAASAELRPSLPPDVEGVVKRLRDRDGIVVAGLFHCVPLMAEAASLIEAQARQVDECESVIRDYHRANENARQATADAEAKIEAQAAEIETWRRRYNDQYKLANQSMEEAEAAEAARDKAMAVLVANLGTLGETKRRFERYEFATHEIECAIKETEEALAAAKEQSNG